MYKYEEPCEYVLLPNSSGSFYVLSGKGEERSVGCSYSVKIQSFLYLIKTLNGKGAHSNPTVKSLDLDREPIDRHY